MKLFDDPIAWFTKIYCAKCKTKSCMPKGMIYTTDPSSKALCVLSLLLMLETDRGLAKRTKRD